MKSFVDRCLIYFELDGVQQSWAISALPGTDNEETLKEHLAKWLPKARYLGHEFSPDKLSTSEEKLVEQGKLSIERKCNG